MAQVNLKTTTTRFTWDFAVDGGAISTITLGTLPNGATIEQAWIDVDTTCTSATDAGTLALGYTGSVSAFDAATAISSGTTWDAAAPRVSDGAADGLVANFIELSSNVNVIATIATEAFTAGKVHLYVRWSI
jgi:hypothetical protein